MGKFSTKPRDRNAAFLRDALHASDGQRFRFTPEAFARPPPIHSPWSWSPVVVFCWGNALQKKGEALARPPRLMTVTLERIVVRRGWLQNNHVNVPKSIVEVCLGRSSTGRVQINIGRATIGTGALQQLTGHLTGVSGFLSEMRVKEEDANRRRFRVWVDDAEKHNLHFEEAPKKARAVEGKDIDHVGGTPSEEVFFFDASGSVFAYRSPRGEIEWHRTPYRTPYLRRFLTNPSLPPKLADRLRLGLLERGYQNLPARTDVAELESEEGRLVLMIHVRRERARGLVRAKLHSVAHPVCEVCGFSFEQQYGLSGLGFAEVHHRTPLANSRTIVLTTLEDLAIVCANCHRMLHRNPWPSIPELRATLPKDKK